MMRNLIDKRINSFKAAFKGLYIFFKEEVHAWIHLAAAITAIIISCYLEISSHHFFIIILLIAMVFATELLNSAIERTVDLAEPEYHVLAGKAKDLAAAAVLIVCITALITGLYIWSKYITLHE